MPRESVASYGVVLPGAVLQNDGFVIENLVEKPTPEMAPSTSA